MKKYLFNDENSYIIILYNLKKLINSFIYVNIGYFIPIFKFIITKVL